MTDKQPVEIKTVDIIVERDPMTKVSKNVPHWELPCWQEKYGDAIEVTGESTALVDELPDAAEELGRMNQQFGLGNEEDQGKQPIVGLVYGRGRDAVDKLHDVIHGGGKSHAKSKAKAGAKDALAD